MVPPRKTISDNQRIKYWRPSNTASKTQIFEEKIIEKRKYILYNAVVVVASLIHHVKWCQTPT